MQKKAGSSLSYASAAIPIEEYSYAPGKRHCSALDWKNCLFIGKSQVSYPFTVLDSPSCPDQMPDSNHLTLSSLPLLSLSHPIPSHPSSQSLPGSRLRILNTALVAAETLPMRRIPFGDLGEAKTDICQEQRSANRRIRREGRLNIHNPQSVSLLQPVIAFSVEIHFVALLVVLSVVSLHSLEVRWWAEMLGRKERRRVSVRLMRWLW